MYKIMKVYYDKSTGHVIWRASYNYEVEPNLDSDYEKVLALKQYEKTTIGLLVLRNGQYEQDFEESNAVRVNPETKDLEFSYPDPNEPEAPPLFQVPLTEQVAALEEQNLGMMLAIAEMAEVDAAEKMSMQLAMAEMAEADAAEKMSIQLAIAELAEMLAGGE